MLLRWWVYFRRGYATYLGFPLSFLNFLIIVYRLVIEPSPLAKGFPTFLEFCVLMAGGLGFLAILLGRYDYWRGSYPREVTVMARQHPFFRDLAQAWVAALEGERERAIQILQEWI